MVDMLAAGEDLSSHSFMEACALDSFLVPGYLGEQRLSLWLSSRGKCEVR